MLCKVIMKFNRPISFLIIITNYVKDFFLLMIPFRLITNTLAKSQCLNVFDMTPTPSAKT